VGRNYGWVFLAYGIAGIAGPQVAGVFKDAAKGGDVSAWLTPFMIAGISCIVAALIGLALKAPKGAAMTAEDSAAGSESQPQPAAVE
jgi:MFS family permease